MPRLPRILSILLAISAPVLPHAAAAQSIERVTLWLGAPLAPEPCETFIIDDYRGESCRTTVQFSFRIHGRIKSGLVLGGSLDLGGLRDSDNEELNRITGLGEGAEPWERFRMRASVTAGAAVPFDDGELRVTGEFLTHYEETSRLLSTERLRLLPVRAEPVDKLSLGGSLALDLDFSAWPWFRTGPKVLLDIRNEVLLGFVDDEQEEAIGEQARALARDVEIVLRPVWSFSFPAGGPGALHFQVGPGFQWEIFGNTAYAALDHEGEEPPPRRRSTVFVALYFGFEGRVP